MRVESRLAAIQNDMRADRHFGDRYDELANLSTDLRHVSAQSNGKSELCLQTNQPLTTIFFTASWSKVTCFKQCFNINLVKKIIFLQVGKHIYVCKFLNKCLLCWFWFNKYMYWLMKTFSLIL